MTDSGAGANEDTWPSFRFPTPAETATRHAASLEPAAAKLRTLVLDAMDRPAAAGEFWVDCHGPFEAIVIVRAELGRAGWATRMESTARNEDLLVIWPADDGVSEPDLGVR